MCAGSVPMQGGGSSPYVVKTICNENQRHRLRKRGMPIVLLTHIPKTRTGKRLCCVSPFYLGRKSFMSVDTVNLHKRLLVCSDNGVIVFPG